MAATSELGFVVGLLAVMTANTKQWICEVCGYIHTGDEPPESCPVCGVGAEMFSLLEVTEPEPEAAPTTATVWRCTICDYLAADGEPPAVCPVCGAGRDLFVPFDEPEDAEPTAAAGDPHLVIVGGGVAAVTAAEQARRKANDLRITLIHKEPDLPYNRLNLTRLLAGEVEPSALQLRTSEWYAEQRIERVAGEAMRVDRQQRRVELRDGAPLTYDRLVLANGAHPFVPPILGVTKTGVYPVRTLEDARQILDRAKSGMRCACIGGGLLGLEAAGALARRGVRVTVLEGFDYLLPRQLAEPAARLLTAYLAELGIEIRTGVKVKEVAGDEEVREVRLEEGEPAPADLVILATGVRPNTYLARQCGLDVAHGVVVDDQLRTSDPLIFAAGDVAEHRGRVYGLWSAALAQGAVAGANAGNDAGDEFTGIPPATQLKVLDLPLFSIGEIQATDGSYRVLEHQAGETYIRLLCRDGRLVGANLLGDIALAAVVKAAVEEGVQVARVGKLRELFAELEDGS